MASTPDRLSFVDPDPGKAPVLARDVAEMGLGAIERSGGRGGRRPMESTRRHGPLPVDGTGEGVAEYHQDIERPGTLCRFDVDVHPIAGLCVAETRFAFGISAADMLCPWKEMHLVQGVTPPTWQAADLLIASGMAGVLVPSAQRPVGVNLILWRWNDDETRKVIAFDPHGDLPVTQASWDLT